MARKLILYCFLFFFSWSITTCSLIPNELKTAEQLIETAPDSALHILQHMSPERYKSDENRALYGLLMAETLGKKKLLSETNSLLDFSIDYYTKHHDGDRLATCFLYKARTFKYSFQYEKAINYYLKALDETNNTADNSLLARIYFDLGDVNIAQGDYVLARQKYKIAYKYFAMIKFQSQAFYSLLNIGRTYYLDKNYSKAQEYYQRILPQAKDSILLGSLYQEMGLNFFQLQKLDSALVYYRKIIKYPYIGNNKAIRYHLLADLYFVIKNTDSAYYYALNAFKYNPPVRTQRECYRILTNSEYLRGNMKEMSMYMSKYVVLGDSLRKIDAQTKGSVIETIHSTKQEVEKKQSWLWYLGILLLIVIIVSILLYIAKHRKNLKELEHNEENHQIQRADIRKQVLLKHRDALLRKIEDRKAAHTNEWKKASLAEREQIDRKMYEELLHLNDIDFFYEEMDTVLNNMVTKLQIRYQLNKKEIQWCCLYLLNVSNQDIMMLLGYSQEALKKMKHRLAKNKFEIDSLRELEAFLFRILTE